MLIVLSALLACALVGAVLIAVWAHRDGKRIDRELAEIRESIARSQQPEPQKPSLHWKGKG